MIIFDKSKISDEELEVWKRFKKLDSIKGLKSLTEFNKKMEIYRNWKAVRHLDSRYPNNYLDPFSIPNEYEIALQEYENLLETSKNERPLQAFFDQNPYFIGSLMRGTQFGHHNTYAFSQFPLANKYRTDFVLCGVNSEGYAWFFIELQSPNDPILTKSKMPTEQVREGLHQLKQWREWFRDNMRYARSEMDMEGLHESRMFYYLIVGRSSDYGNEENNWRSSEQADNKWLTIMSYDRVGKFYRQMVKEGFF